MVASVKIPYLHSRFSFPSGHVAKGALLLGSMALGQWLLTDLVHIPGGWLGFFALGAGIFWFSKTSIANFESPLTVQGWIRRCNEALEQFKDLDNPDKSQIRLKERVNTLKEIVERDGPQKIAFVGTTGVNFPDKVSVQSAISGPNSINLSWSSSLPLRDKSWMWPKVLFEQDFLVYVLPLPLKASDLLWLKQIPDKQPSWVLVTSYEPADWSEQLKILKAQLPERWLDRILRLDQSQKDLSRVLIPVSRALEKPKININNTRQRLLANLHTTWQKELEYLRRSKFKSVQNKTQWVVAGAVFASPVPSTDLLALSVANGLMIQEMAQIWSCTWKIESLKVIARQLSQAAIAQGVVEWSSHALFSLAKLHGGSWFAAGGMQALSAAYLTRVVGRSMADWMALNNGVSEPDLEELKKQAPKLVAVAAEQERLDWGGFIMQAKNWMNERGTSPKIETSYVEAI